MVRIFRALHIPNNMGCYECLLAIILKTVFLGKKYQFFFFGAPGPQPEQKCYWWGCVTSSTPKTIAPWKPSHDMIYLFMYNIRSRILSLFSTSCQCLVAPWLPCLNGIQFFRYDHEYFIPLPSYMHVRLTCQPATRPTGRAKRGPEDLWSDTNWIQASRAGYMHVYTFKACSIKMNNDAKNIVHYSKFSLIILNHAIFDDSVTVIELNLTHEIQN